MLDGHDGAGKTTLAAMLAESLGGVHVRPFAGDTGRLLISYVNQGNVTLAADLARQAVEETLSKSEAPVLVFDRHWMTAFSVLPETYWNEWQPLPPTTLCWADLQTTLQRVNSRSHDEGESYDHRHFLSVYWELAKRFECNILRTDQLSLDESFASLYSWAAHFVKP